MKKNAFASVTPIALLPVLAISSQLAGHQPHYTLIDMGTFGGPQSYLNDGNSGNNAVSVLNNRGTLVGGADTAVPDFDAPFCFNEDCFVSHAFRWDAGVRTDLGPLAEGRSSFADWISQNGLIVGFAENGDFDPLAPNLTERRAVLWREGRILDLGTLPEGGYESQANAVNSKGQVVGWATNTVPDPNSMIAPGFYPTQSRAFLWEKGAMRDLGTLGTGTDAIAQFINERGQVVGWSFTGAPPVGPCPIFTIANVPISTGSFIWDKKDGMRDLGNLGGNCVIATGINNEGAVIGDNVNDQPIQRAFVWKDETIRDLGGSIGGNSTGAEAINDAGEVAGFATLAGEVSTHAVLWKHVGEIIDLGTPDPSVSSFAMSINSKTQVVGGTYNSSGDLIHAVLWEGGSLYDLNDVIGPGAALTLQLAEDINERGEIAGVGVDASGNLHAFLLIPCDERTVSDCQEATETGTSAGPVRSDTVARRVSVQDSPSTIDRMRHGAMSGVPLLLRTAVQASGFRASKTQPGNDPATSKESKTQQQSDHTLTGYCWGSVLHGAPQQCGVAQDHSQCPAGQPAINPTTVSGCLPPQTQLVDHSRLCRVQNSSGRVITGYCQARY